MNTSKSFAKISDTLKQSPIIQLHARTPMKYCGTIKTGLRVLKT